jgi:exodeoxyribonuclease-1
MAASFFFYDLETSGLDPKTARIMQFAGQRTNLDLQPIGEPVNSMIKLTPDILPDPDAVMITGITPQMTIDEGITEAEFLQFFNEHVATSETIFVGFNSVRFDDEFMRYLHYRNFYDAYEWQWRDGCSRWDLLDVVRMTRALRPNGIIWPFAPDGSPANRLEFLTKVNRLDHISAHDALSDVHATIAVARLLQAKQPRLFAYLLSMRDKKKVAALVGAHEPFIYTSGSYSSETEKTTAVLAIAEDPKTQGVWVYDLRYDPAPFLALSVEELATRMRWQPRGVERLPFPVKLLRFNRCPAVAPLSVLDKVSQKHLKVNLLQMHTFRSVLSAEAAFGERIIAANELLNKKRPQASIVGNELTVDGQLYDGFVGDADRRMLYELRETMPAALSDFSQRFRDVRMQALVPLYIARNYPEALSDEARATWERFREQCLFDGGAKSRFTAYMERIVALSSASSCTEKQRFLLEELRLYGESIMPVELFAS